MEDLDISDATLLPQDSETVAHSGVNQGAAELPAHALENGIQMRGYVSHTLRRRNDIAVFSAPEDEEDGETRGSSGLTQAMKSLSLHNEAASPTETTSVEIENDTAILPCNPDYVRNILLMGKIVRVRVRQQDHRDV